MPKNNKFEVYPGKILVSPIRTDGILAEALAEGSDANSFEEMGIVMDVGAGVKFVKKGDTVFFVKWGIEKTPEINGKAYYVIPDSIEFIIGKISNGAKRK